MKRNFLLIVLLAMAALSAVLLAVANLAGAREPVLLPARPALCQVVLRAPALPPRAGELRSPWPASGWLQPHEAAGALDLGQLPEGDHLWRVLLRGDRCRALTNRQGYVALAQEFTPDRFPALATPAWKMEIDRKGEKLTLPLSQVDGRTDVALGAPYLPGGFSGVELELDDAKER